MDITILLSKLLPLFLYPLNFALLMLFIAMLALWRGWRRSGTLFVTLSFLFLTASAMPPVAKELAGRLERQYLPLSVEQSPQADAIIVLGGGVNIKVPPRVTAELGEGADRVLHAARLYKAGRAPIIIASGGNVFPQTTALAEAAHMAELLQEWGVPAGAIVTEQNSRNTHENALAVEKLIDRNGYGRVLLVTSAIHMPRAMATFRSAGIDVVASPTDILVTKYRQPGGLDWMPSVGALGLTTLAVKEYIGTAIYESQGWIKK